MARQNIYDTDKFFEHFKINRSSGIHFNDCIEKPILTAMLPDMKGKTVLDLGCGMGQHAREYADMGAESVRGTDISEKMLGYAAENNGAEKITYRRLACEELDTLKESFDVVASSLTFDYIEDFPKLMKDIYRLVNPGGPLVFSMSHPMLSAGMENMTAILV